MASSNGNALIIEYALMSPGNGYKSTSNRELPKAVCPSFDIGLSSLTTMGDHQFFLRLSSSSPQLAKPGEAERESNSAETGGGGGIRTRVLTLIRIGIYMHSRSFSLVPPASADKIRRDQLPKISPHGREHSAKPAC